MTREASAESFVFRVIPLGVIGLTHTHTHTHTHTCTHTHMHTHMHTHTHTHTHKQEYGLSALHYAAREGRVGVAEALLKAGCNKDLQSKV
jgi:hypothetical protein